MKKIDLSVKAKPVKLGVYFAALISLVLTLTTILFAFYMLFSIKNVANEYESDIYKLRYELSAIMIQTFVLDVKRNEFKSTEKILDTLKNDNLLAYAYVKDNETNKIILGNQDAKADLNKNVDVNQNIKHLSRVIEKYTVFFGIEGSDNRNVFDSRYFKMLINILLLFIAFGIIVSILMSTIIARPLEKLLKGAKEIAGGNFDFKLEDSNFEEINDLITSFNEMRSQLDELYTSLEQKVQQRTKDLAEANYKLQETQAMMVHSEKMRSLGELVAGIAHEINNPVNFIHGNIMIFKNYADDMLKLIDLYEENSNVFPPEIKDKIENLKKEIDLEFLRGDIQDLIKSCIEGTQRTKNIILDLKNFSRMEEQVLTEFNIPKEIDTTLNILNNKYKNRITVTKNYNEDVPKIEAYGGQLNQVFMNILDNAQDAMGDMGNLIINVYKENQNVKIEFIDDGKGIPEENLSKVFDPFFTTKPVGKGTGLGMSISYRVINSHNGSIEVDSTVGKGTKFTITLPINQPKKEELDTQSEN